MASPGSGAREAQNYMKLFVAHEMTQNNTVNKVHVAATELPQLLSQNTNMFGKSLKKINCWKSRGHVPQCSIAGDADGKRVRNSFKLKVVSIGLP